MGSDLDGNLESQDGEDGCVVVKHSKNGGMMKIGPIGIEPAKNPMRYSLNMNP